MPTSVCVSSEYSVLPFQSLLCCTVLLALWSGFLAAILASVHRELLNCLSTSHFCKFLLMLVLLAVRFAVCLKTCIMYSLGSFLLASVR